MAYVLAAPPQNTMRERARALVTRQAPLSPGDECAVAEWHEKLMGHDRPLSEQAADARKQVVGAPVQRRRPVGPRLAR